MSHLHLIVFGRTRRYSLQFASVKPWAALKTTSIHLHDKSIPIEIDGHLPSTPHNNVNACVFETERCLYLPFGRSFSLCFYWISKWVSNFIIEMRSALWFLIEIQNNKTKLQWNAVWFSSFVGFIHSGTEDGNIHSFRWILSSTNLFVTFSIVIHIEIRSVYSYFIWFILDAD